MGMKIDFLPCGEMIRQNLQKCVECGCRVKYLQIYQYGTDMKIRCPKCNHYVVERGQVGLIQKWNKVPS